MPRSPSISRPVQWPSTLVCGWAMPPTIRCVMVSESERSLECTLATTTSSSAEQLVGLVEPAVLQDVHLDPLQAAERRHPRR